jgi:hypothetical protein
MSVRPQPGGRWYLLGVGIIVLGAGGVLGIGLWRVQEQVESMPRSQFPYPLVVELEPGEYDLYHEERTVIDGSTVEAPAGFGLTCGAIDLATSQVVPVAASSTRDGYSAGPYQGRELGELRVERRGVYRMVCEVSPPRNPVPGERGPRFVIALGRGVPQAIDVTVRWALGLAGVGVLALLVVRSKRKRWFREHRPHEPPQAPSVPPSPEQPLPRSVPIGT